MTWSSGAGPGGLTRKRPGWDINIRVHDYSSQLTQNVYQGC